MATVRMRKGNFYADIYNSEETIANAQKEGYVLVKEEPREEKPIKAEEVQTETVNEEKVEKPAHRRTSRK